MDDNFLFTVDDYMDDATLIFKLALYEQADLFARDCAETEYFDRETLVAYWCDPLGDKWYGDLHQINDPKPDPRKPQPAPTFGPCEFSWEVIEAARRQWYEKTKKE